MIDFLGVIQHLLPRTRTWSLVVDTTLRRFFAGIADGLLTPARAAADSVWAALDPETTSELAEWENQFDIWETDASDANRRIAIEAAWNSATGQSPRYLQDRMQAAGFDIYYHGWRNPGGSVRDPHDYCTASLYGTAQCLSEAYVDDVLYCGPEDDLTTLCCDSFIVNETNYLVNEGLNGLPNPALPTDETRWRYFIYWGGETFGTTATVPAARLVELKRMLLKYCPAHLWIVMLIEVPSYPVVFSSEFSSEFG